MFIPSNSNDKILTDMEMKDWERKRDAKTDDFPMICLSKEELRLLRRIIKEGKDYIKVDENNIDHATRLRDFDFIRIMRTDCPGKESVQFCEIRARGITYSNYIDAEKRKEKRSRAHDWKIAVFSVLGGAFLSAPLWAFIRWALEKLLA